MTEKIAEPNEKEAVSWGFGEVALGFLIAFVCSGALNALAQELFPAAGGQRPLVVSIASLLGLWLGFGLMPLLATNLKGRRSLNADFGLRMRWSDAPIGLGIGVAGQLVLVNAIFFTLRTLFPGSFDNVSESAKTLTNYEGWEFGVILLAVVIGAPFFEELFFRGLLQRSVAKRFGAIAAVLISGVCFGLIHYQPDTVSTLPALVAFGLVLAYVAHHSGRLGLCIFAHIGFNLTTMVVIIAQRWGA